MAPKITADANSTGGIDLVFGGIGCALAPEQALTLASRIMNQLGVGTLTNNPDGTWTAAR